MKRFATARNLVRALLAAAFAVACPAAAGALDVQSFKLARGEDVWFVSDHTLPMIAMTAALPAGSAYDPAAKPGLASFAATMLDEGAGKLNADAFQTALGNRAIRLTVTSERDWLIVSLVTLSDNARDAFQLLGLALSHPRFDQDAIQRVRAQILSELAQQDEDPAAVAGKAFYRAWFHDHPYGHAIDGDAASVAAINAGDLKGFAATHWVGGGLKIAISGDVDQTQLMPLLKSAFGALSPRMPPAIPPVGRTGQPGIQVVPMPVPQPTAMFGLPGMMRNDRDFIAGYVADYILGGGDFASRLTNEVREKRGLTYDISTSLDTFRRAGVVTGEVASRAGAMRQTIDVIRQTLHDFSANGPTPEELDDARTYLTGSFPLEFSSNVGIAAQLNTFQREGLPADYVKKRNALVSGVTADDVARAARRLFNPARLTIVVAGTAGGGPAAKPAAQAPPHTTPPAGTVRAPGAAKH